MILALETATSVCSVAYEDREGVVHEKRTEQRGAHSEQLFLFIEALMAEHDFNIGNLDAVLISEGPGSYTGLRIGASAIKGLLFQKEVPLYSINTLTSFAMTAAEKVSGKVGSIHSIIDARRKHFYYQPYEYADGQLSPLKEIQVIPIKEFEKVTNKGDIIIGTGIERIDETVRQKARTFGLGSITAKALIRVFHDQEKFINKVDPESFSPEYYTSNQISN